MEPKYNCMVILEDGLRLMVLPGGQTETDAIEQQNRVLTHLMKFPGGTQSVSVYLEPTL